MKYTVPVKGGAGQIQEGPYDAMTSEFVSANVRDNTYSKGGKQVSSRHIVVSRDGKTMRATLKGINATGQTVAGTEIYEKQ